jgi:hypothetical protein
MGEKPSKQKNNKNKSKLANKINEDEVVVDKPKIKLTETDLEHLSKQTGLSRVNIAYLFEDFIKNNPGNFIFLL